MRRVRVRPAALVRSQFGCLPLFWSSWLFVPVLRGQSRVSRCGSLAWWREISCCMSEEDFD